jgi:hypothetical protein
MNRTSHSIVVVDEFGSEKSRSVPGICLRRAFSAALLEAEMSESIESIASGLLVCGETVHELNAHALVIHYHCFPFLQ